MDQRISQLKQYLAERFSDHLSVQEMAARVNMSLSHLSHLFKREMGVSPQEFLKQTRMSHARNLLENTFLTVKQVMVLCGFNDASHFVRDFERQFGETPRRYREHYVGSASTPRSSPGQRIAESANDSRLPVKVSRKHSHGSHGYRRP